MTTKLSFFALSALAFSVALVIPPAIAQPATATAMPGNMNQSSTKAMSGADMKTMMKDMSNKMGSMPMTGNVDVDFAMMMRIHHQGAVDMAEAQLRDGKDSQMRKMAKDIIASQKKEIAQFDKFIEKSPEKAKK